MACAQAPSCTRATTSSTSSRLYARYGVTTVVSLGGDRDEGFKVRDEQETPTLDRARLHVAGRVVDATTPERARGPRSRPSRSTKPDWVKIRVDDNLGTTPKMTPIVYRAVIEEAHRRGLRVAAHIFYLEDARGAAGGRRRLPRAQRPGPGRRRRTSWPPLPGAESPSARR